MKVYSGLGEPSITSKQDCFAALSIVVGHKDPKASAGARTVLHSLGCCKVVLARTGEELISSVRRGHGDLAVVDWDLRDAPGAEAVRSLRRRHTLPGRDLPVILLAPSGQDAAAAVARDAGANEVVRKPVTARELLAAIFTVIEAPRPFVVTEGYVGPDRRIKRKMGLRVPGDTPAPPRPPGAATPVATAADELGRLIQLLLLSPRTEGESVAAIRRTAESVARQAAGQEHRRVWQVARLLVTFCD